MPKIRCIHRSTKSPWLNKRNSVIINFNNSKSYIIHEDSTITSHNTQLICDHSHTNEFYDLILNHDTLVPKELHPYGMEILDIKLHERLAHSHPTPDVYHFLHTIRAIMSTGMLEVGSAPTKTLTMSIYRTFELLDLKDNIYTIYCTRNLDPAQVSELDIQTQVSRKRVEFSTFQECTATVHEIGTVWEMVGLVPTTIVFHHSVKMVLEKNELIHASEFTRDIRVAIHSLTVEGVNPVLRCLNPPQRVQESSVTLIGIQDSKQYIRDILTSRKHIQHMGDYDVKCLTTDVLINFTAGLKTLPVRKQYYRDRTTNSRFSWRYTFVPTQVFVLTINLKRRLDITVLPHYSSEAAIT